MDNLTPKTTRALRIRYAGFPDGELTNGWGHPWIDERSDLTKCWQQFNREGQPCGSMLFGDEGQIIMQFESCGWKIESIIIVYRADEFYTYLFSSLAIRS